MRIYNFSREGEFEMAYLNKNVNLIQKKSKCRQLIKNSGDIFQYKFN